MIFANIIATIDTNTTTESIDDMDTSPNFCKNFAKIICDSQYFY